jgi:hypothetical protein
LLLMDGFSGTGSSLKVLADQGHKVIGFDLIPGPYTVIANVFEVAADPIGWCMKHLGGLPDHGHFSFPCETWAVGAVSTHWHLENGIYSPKTKGARLGIMLLDATLYIIEVLRKVNPDFTFSVENPAGIAHKWLRQEKHWIVEYETFNSYCCFGPIGPVSVIEGPPLVYCQKNTIVWTNLKTWQARRCLSRPPKARIVDGPKEFRDASIQFVERDGKPCHENAYRGAKRGIQRIKGAGGRAMFPKAFSHALCTAILQAHQEV